MEATADKEHVVRSRQATEPWYQDLVRVHHLCAATEVAGSTLETSATTSADSQHPPVEIDPSTGLRELFELFMQSPRVSVRLEAGCRRVLQAADLECLPARIWIFGVITCFEQGLLELVRTYYPTGEYGNALTAERQAASRSLLSSRWVRHEALDLADCLQLADKRELLLHLSQAHQRFGFESMNQAKRFFEHAEALRDRLVHGHDLAAGASWSEVLQLVLRMLQFIEAYGTDS